MREDLRDFTKDFDKSEDDLKSLQSGVGQIIGEVLRQLTEDKCTTQRGWRLPFIPCTSIHDNGQDLDRPNFTAHLHMILMNIHESMCLLASMTYCCSRV